MLIAVVGTLLHKDIIRYDWILGGLVLGSGIGVAISAWIPMTKMPERIAFSHAFGGLATALVGVAEYMREAEHLTHFKVGALGFETFLGFLTFTGSLMAYGKLQGVISGAPVTWKGQNFLNIGLFFGSLCAIGVLVAHREMHEVFFGIAGTGLALGVMAVLPIGGADMPVVISLLNSYAGLAACATGFALGSQILIISGALDGSSGLLLSLLMSKAMNRSFANVLFGAFGTAIEPGQASSQQQSQGLQRGHGRGRRGGVESVAVGHLRAGLRDGRQPGAARRARPRGIPRAPRGRREIRDSPRRRPNARSYERTARRGERSLRQALRPGRHQRRLRAHGRRHRRRCERCREPRGEEGSRRARSTGCPSSTWSSRAASSSSSAA